VEWTVAAANEVMHHRSQERDAVHALSACPSLSHRWRETLARRAATGTVGSSFARVYGPNT
jgi:MOSC domain-containing protein YiiM